MEKQIVFSGKDIVTLRVALDQAERALRARADALSEIYSEVAGSALKFAEDCHALSEYIYDQVLGGKSNG